MTAAATLQSLAIPPPFQGQFDRDPIAAVENPYAEQIRNFNSTSSGLALRKADKLWNSVSTVGGTCMNLSLYGPASDSALFEVVRNFGTPNGLKWYSVESPGTVSVVQYSRTSEDNEITSLAFNNNLYWFGDTGLRPSVDGPVVFDANTGFGNAAYTWPSGFEPFGGGVYKNRAYFLNRNSAKYVYTGVDRIGGATTLVDLSPLVTAGAFLYGIKSISVSQGIQQQNVLAFIFNTGEVLVYAGGYPGGADWTIIGKFETIAPLYYNSFVDVQGDTLVIGGAAIISLRSLFLQGPQIALQQSITDSIPFRWSQITTAIVNSSNYSKYQMFLSGVYDIAQNRLIITVPNLVDYDGSISTGANLFLIYQFRTQSWVEHSGPIFSILTGYVTSSVFRENSVFYGTSANTCMFRKEYRNNYLDERASVNGATSPILEGAYAVRAKSAPVPLSKFGINKICGMEIILSSDQLTNMLIKLVGDLGAQQTGNQPITANGTNITRTYLSIGIVGSYAQWQLDGTTQSGTIGLSIYGVNVWFESGGVR